MQDNLKIIKQNTTETLQLERKRKEVKVSKKSKARDIIPFHNPQVRPAVFKTFSEYTLKE